MAPYLYTRSRVRNGMIPFVYNRDITKDKKYYKMLGNRFCSPAKIIKRYLKRIFESVYGELTRKNFKELSDLENIDIFLEGNDFKCIFNSVVYSEVLDLYLVYLSLYKKYGFTKDYLDKVILKDTNPKTNSKPKFNYFDSSGVKWKKRIKLSPTDRNIILLREIPFFIEDFFEEVLDKRLSQEIIYMFSFFYLYFLVDYEFMLSNNEKTFGQEGLFKETQIFKKFFEYIIQRNSKDCLKKYTINEEIISLLKTKSFLLPFLKDNYLDFVDYAMAKEVFKKYNITNFDYKKIEELGLVSFIYGIVEEKFGELSGIVDKILSDFLVFMEKEKIVYLIFERNRDCGLMGGLISLGNRMSLGIRMPLGRGLGFGIYDEFSGFSEYRFSRLRDQDNQLKKRRFQDIKLSRLYLTFCGEENMKKLRFKK